MNKIAAFIKENRRAAGLTQEEFAWSREKKRFGWIRSTPLLPCSIWKPSPAESMTNSRLNCHFENRTFVKQSLLWYNERIKGGFHYG